MKKIRVAVGTWNVNGGKQLRLPTCKDQVVLIKNCLLNSSVAFFCSF